MAYELYLDASVILKMDKIKVMDKCIRDVRFFFGIYLYMKRITKSFHSKYSKLFP